jgi:hypothetical protein
MNAAATVAVLTVAPVTHVPATVYDPPDASIR